MSTADGRLFDYSLASESWSRTHFSVDRPGPTYCQVTFGHAPIKELGLNTDSDLERSLGRRVVESTPDP
jgi:hypothetical protein